MTTESNVLAFLKKQSLQCLGQKFQISDFHLLALFFNPNFKSVRSPGLANEDRKRVHDIARSLTYEVVLPPADACVNEEHDCGQPT